jgi:hypothetical protein
MAFDSPPPQTTRPQPTIPTVTPSALLTVQEDTAVAKDTPFLDRFVGERDKDDKEKLTGVLKETVDMLAPSKHDRSLKVMSANGKETLISMVPKSKTESGFIQLARESNWLQDIFEHTRSSVTAGATSVAKYIACFHPREFRAAAEDEAGMIRMKSMGTNECEAMIQDGNLTMNQFNVVRQHVTFTAGDSFKMTYRPSDIKKLEGSQTGPEPMFGMFKNESENGDIEN